MTKTIIKQELTELDHYKRECIILAFALSQSCEILAGYDQENGNLLMEKFINDFRQQVPECPDCINNILNYKEVKHDN